MSRPNCTFLEADFSRFFANNSVELWIAFGGQNVWIWYPLQIRAQVRHFITKQTQRLQKTDVMKCRCVPTGRFHSWISISRSAGQSRNLAFTMFPSNLAVKFSAIVNVPPLDVANYRTQSLRVFIIILGCDAPVQSHNYANGHHYHDRLDSHRPFQ